MGKLNHSPCRVLAIHIVPRLLSCGKGNADANDTSVNDDQNVSTSDDSQDGGEKNELDPGAVNYGGYEFEMLTETNSYQYNLYAYTGDGYPSQVTDVALWYRAMQMKDEYGVNLVLNNQGKEAYNTVFTGVGGQSLEADIVMLNAKNTMLLAQNGYIFDVNTLPNLNLEASYWDQRIQTEYKIGNSLFCLEGDFNFADDFATYVTIYNDTLYNNYGFYEKYGTPYDLARQGKWTYEKMGLMIADLAEDNGDGEWDENDKWGMLAETPMPYYFFLGSGMKLMSNKNGELVVNLNDDTGWMRMYEIIEDMTALCLSPDTLVAERLDVGGALWDVVSDIFKYDRALFRTTSLSAVNRLIDMKSNYGIMPIPAYEESSEADAAYYCWLQAGLHYPMSFPITIKDVDKTSNIAEILSYVSRYGADSLYTAFYDLLSYARLCRTANDVEMLKLVFANKTFDIDDALQISKMHDVVRKALLNDSTVNGAMGRINTEFTKEKRANIQTKMQEIVIGIINNTTSYVPQ